MSKKYKNIWVIITLVFVVLSLILVSSCATNKSISVKNYAFIKSISLLDKSCIENVSVGKWLENSNGCDANWLGIKYKDRFLREPINIIIIDSISKSNTDAVLKIISECKKAGYKLEFGHTSGYCGLINNVLYTQIPKEKQIAFSDDDFFLTNNHGRIIGPVFLNEKYIFIAAFSTEKPSIIHGFNHKFISFTKARNEFCKSMNNKTVYKLLGYVNLNNTLNTCETTTADHDGNLVILKY